MHQKRLLLPLLAVFAFGFSACDSGDEASDLDVLIGSHLAVSIADGRGDQTAQFSQLVNQLRTDIRGDGTFSLVIDYSALGEMMGRVDATISGNYELNQRDRILTLRVPMEGVLIPVVFNYEILANNQTRFTTPAGIFNTLLGLSGDQAYTGNLVIVVQRV